jgi:hypothetical protein
MSSVAPGPDGAATGSPATPNGSRSRTCSTSRHPSAELTDTLARLELTGITVRHRMQPLAETPRSASPAMRGTRPTSLRSRRPAPA